MVSDEMVLRAAKTLLVAINRISDETLPNKIARTCRRCAMVAAIASFVTGWLPVAGAILATLVSTIAIWTMYVKINTAIEIPFSRNLIKSILVAIGTNLVAYFATIVIATFISLIPGLGSLIAAGAMAVATYVITLASAYVYLNVLAKMFGKTHELKSVNLERFSRIVKPVVEDADVREVAKATMVGLDGQGVENVRNEEQKEN